MDPGRRPGEPARIHLADELPQRIERLIPYIGARPLQRLDLVQYEQESWIAAITKDGQESLQETECAEVVEFALDASGPAHRAGDVRLTADPGGEALGFGRVACGGCRSGEERLS